MLNVTNALNIVQLGIGISSNSFGFQMFLQSIRFSLLYFPFDLQACNLLLEVLRAAMEVCGTEECHKALKVYRLDNYTNWGFS